MLAFNKVLQGLLAEMSERTVKVGKGICCLCGLDGLLSLKLQHIKSMLLRDHPNQ
jgi:hypothetical protein